MSSLKIVNGIAREGGVIDPALGESITRAQMMAIIVRAFGAEPIAIARKGAQPFPDVSGDHWASGYVAVAVDMAAAKGVTLGRPTGLFDPEAQVTLAEALAFIMKFLGVQRDTTAAWPMDYIQGALAAGLITESDRDTLLDFPSLPASRGMAFALADTIFYNYKGIAGGKSVYTAYVDPQAPAISFEGVPGTTEAESLVVTGRVDLDATGLTMNGQKVKVNADGTFSVTVPLALGANTLTFEAEDLAGNKTTAPLTITRGEPTPVGPKIAELKASTNVAAVLEKVTLTPLDEEGNPITEGVVYSTDQEDSVILRNGSFQAVLPGRYFVKASVGKLFATTIIEVYGTASALKIEAPTIVANGVASKSITVTAVDQNGTPVLNFGKNGEKIRLTGTGITTYDENGVETAEVTAKDGKAVFKVKVSPYLAGESLSLSARHDGNPVLTGTGILQTTFPTASALKVEGPDFLAANKGVTVPDAVKVWVVDQDGAPIQSPYLVQASITGPAALINTSAAYSNEAAPATFDLNNWNTVGIVGTITLTFTVEGVGSAVHTIEHLIAGSPNRLVVTADKSSRPANETFTFTVVIQDRNGIPVSYSDASDTSLTIVLPADLASKFQLPASDPVILKGQSSTTFTLAPKAKFTGDLLVTVNGPSGMTGSTTVTVTPGPVFSRSFDRQKAVVPVISPSAQFSGYAADLFGNPVVQANVTMKVHVQEVANTTAYAGTATNNVTINGQVTSPASPLTVKTNAEGKVELNVKALPYVNKTYLLTLTNENGGDPAYAHLVVLQTVPNTIEVSTYRYINELGAYFQSTTVTAGDTFYVKVRVKDVFQGPVSNIASELKLAAGQVFSLDGNNLVDSSLITFQPYTSLLGDPKKVAEMQLQEGDYVATLVAGIAGRQTITVEYNMTVDKVSGSQDVVVNPGQYVKAVLNDGKPIKVKVGSVTGPYILKLADRFGNTVSTTTRQEVVLQPTLGGVPTTAMGFRLEPGGTNVSKVETFSEQKLWIDVNTLGTFTINVIGGTTSTSVQVEVTAN
ncbi:MAG: S-layer homology domain-containing protein [Bacillota bacterium]